MLKKFTWAHGVILALACFICFILYLVLIFPMGQKNSELIADDYYEQELIYQKVIDAKTNADKLAEKPAYSVENGEMILQFSKDNAPESGNVSFYLYRSDDANLDIKKTEKLNAAGQLRIPGKVLVPGSYILKLNWERNNTPYQVDYDVQWN